METADPISSLSSPVWFAYPQTGTFKNFFTRKNLTGTVNISNDSLILNSDNGTEILHYPIDAVIKVMSRAGQTMTFTFNDNKKFSVNFALNLSPDKFRRSFTSLRPVGRFPSNETNANLQPFLDYFKQQGLIG